MFSCDIGKIFKYTLFYRTSLVAASVNWLCQYLSFLSIFFIRFYPVEKCGVILHIAYIVIH